MTYYARTLEFLAPPEPERDYRVISCSVVVVVGQASREHLQTLKDPPIS